METQNRIVSVHIAIILLVQVGCDAEREQGRLSNIVGASLLCREATWDFGTVDSVSSPKITHSFNLSNSTEGVVQIEEITPSCGCIISEDRPSEVLASGSIDLPVTVKLPPIPGQFSKSVLVRFRSDLAKPAEAMVLSIKGQIATNSSLYSIPHQVDFGHLKSHDKKMRLVKVMTYDRSRFTVLDAKSNHPAVSVTTNLKGPEPGEMVELRIEINAAQLPISDFAATITLTSTNLPQQRYIIPLRAQILSDSPIVDSILIAAIRPGEYKDCVLSKSDLPRITAINFTGSSDLKAELVRLNETGYAARFHCSAECTIARLIKGRLIVHFSDQANTLESNSVPVQALVSSVDSGSE